MTKRMTKKEALAAAGYEPKVGRPPIHTEPTETVSWRCPASTAAKIPKRGGHDRSQFLTDAVEREAERRSGSK